MRALALAAAFMMAACHAPVVTACPPVPIYSPEFQWRLADEIHALPPDSALGQAIIDYKRLRDQLRACRAT
jgi:hypothetical protein